MPDLILSLFIWRGFAVLLLALRGENESPAPYWRCGAYVMLVRYYLHKEPAPRRRNKYQNYNNSGKSVEDKETLVGVHLSYELGRGALGALNSF